jgi:hypothetical protein
MPGTRRSATSKASDATSAENPALFILVSQAAVYRSMSGQIRLPTDVQAASSDAEPAQRRSISAAAGRSVSSLARPMR